MGWGHGCRQLRLCVSITLGNLLSSEMPELRAESSPLLSPCPQLCAGVLHPSSPSAGSWHHPLLPLLWFSKPWPCGDAPTHSPQPQPLHSCFSLLLFLLFHSSFIFFFFPFPQASYHRLLQPFPCKLFILPLPLPHPNLLLLLSCLGCVVWVVGTKSGHAKPYQCHFIPLIPAFHPPLCRRACLPAHGCVLAVGWLWSSAPTLWLIYTFLGQLILHSAPE